VGEIGTGGDGGSGINKGGVASGVGTLVEGGAGGGEMSACGAFAGA
jgi:hypothetical protein